MNSLAHTLLIQRFLHLGCFAMGNQQHYYNVVFRFAKNMSNDDITVYNITMCDWLIVKKSTWGSVLSHGDLEQTSHIFFVVLWGRESSGRYLIKILPILPRQSDQIFLIWENLKTYNKYVASTTVEKEDLLGKDLVQHVYMSVQESYMVVQYGYMAIHQGYLVVKHSYLKK